MVADYLLSWKQESNPTCLAPVQDRTVGHTGTCYFSIASAGILGGCSPLSPSHPRSGTELQLEQRRLETHPPGQQADPSNHQQFSLLRAGLSQQFVISVV